MLALAGTPLTQSDQIRGRLAPEVTGTASPPAGEASAKKQIGPDTGLLSLTLVASILRVATDPAVLAHELALTQRHAHADDILRGARLLKLKARLATKRLPADLEATPLPAIVELAKGGWGVLLRRLPHGSFQLVHAATTGGSISSEISAAELSVAATGSVILVTRRLGLEQSAATSRAFGWLLPTLWRYRKPLATVLVASLCIQIFALVTPLFFQLVVDKVLTHHSLSTLMTVTLAMVVVGLFDSVLQYLRTYILSHTASRVDVELGARLFDHLTRLPVGYFETRPAGLVISRVRELEQIRAFLTGPALSSVLDLAFSIAFLAVLFHLSMPLGVIVLCSLPLYATVGLVVRPILKARIDESAQRLAANQQYLIETVVGYQTLKSAAIEPTLRAGWEDRLASYVNSAFRTAAIGSIGQNAIGFINKTTLALVLFVGAQEVIEGNMTVGALIAFNMLLGQTVQPILRLSQLWQDFQQCQVSMERLRGILDAPVEPRPQASGALPAPRGAIELRNVTFRYRPDLPAVLQDLNLNIGAGEVVGIVGASGSGKSTIAKILQRFYRPEEGQILIDGVNVMHADPTWVRRNMAVVQQESILFNRTVHENIALANPAMTRGEVIELARLAGADEFINLLPLGYDTMIEERGANLSGGQRQRIAIARALAVRPRILILDEATSALDYESETIIRRNMAHISRGRTVIVIAHRLAAVRNCDRIVALRGGKVVESGTHDELVGKPDGVYSQLWRLQSEALGRQ